MDAVFKDRNIVDLEDGFRRGVGRRLVLVQLGLDRLVFPETDGGELLEPVLGDVFATAEGAYRFVPSGKLVRL